MAQTLTYTTNQTTSGIIIDLWSDDDYTVNVTGAQLTSTDNEVLLLYTFSAGSSLDLNLTGATLLTQADRNTVVVRDASMTFTFDATSSIQNSTVGFPDDGRGLYFSGALDTTAQISGINAGTITAVLPVVISDAYGGVAIRNDGLITAIMGTATLESAAVIISAGSGTSFGATSYAQATFVNNGVITAATMPASYAVMHINASNLLQNARILNHGTMYGSVFTDEGADLVLNSGTITRISQDIAGQPHAIDTNDGNDKVINTGTINGTVGLGDGNDLFDGRNAAGTSGTVYGELGNDRLLGGSGADTFDGGSGNDTLMGRDGADTLIDDAGNDLLRGGAGNDSLSSGGDNDTLLGDAGLDTLDGGWGTDYLNGGADADLMYGGLHDDTLIGGTGNDTLWGGQGADRMIGGADDDLMMGDSENDTLVGSEGNDTLQGGTGADYLNGGIGADSLLGESENDRLVGDAGNDTLDGGSGDDRLIGGADADVLIGGSGRDVLLGDAGNDTLTGGADGDVMLGGAGADVFVFAAGDSAVGGTNSDRLADFVAGEDKIDLSGVIDGELAFYGTAWFTDTAAVRLNEVNANLTVVEVDSNGDGTADMQIWVMEGGLTASDFIL